MNSLKKHVLTLVLACLPLGAAAAPDAATLLDGMSGRLETAYAHGEDAALGAELAKCEAILAADPGHARALYYKAWILMSRASQLNPDKDKARAKALFDGAEAALGAALKAGPDAEVLSLHATTLERSISVKGGLSAMKLGPAAGREHDEALKLAPENPRVRMMNGISLLNKPSFVGGSPEKALEEFQKAAALFEKEAPESNAANQFAPRWGRVEVWAWIGQALVKLDRKEEARKAYEKGLELDPNYGWIKFALLPKLGS